VTELAPHGGDEQRGVATLQCPAGALLVGVVINLGGVDAPDALGIQCALVRPDGTTAAPTTTMLVGSDQISIEDQTACDRDEVATELLSLSGPRPAAVCLGCENALDRAKQQLVNLKRTMKIGNTNPPSRGAFSEQVGKCDPGTALVGVRVGLGRVYGLFASFPVVGQLTPLCAPISLQ
jgi:hypothetical protein